MISSAPPPTDQLSGHRLCRRSVLGLALVAGVGAAVTGVSGCSATATGTGSATATGTDDPSATQPPAAGSDVLVVWADPSRAAAVMAIGSEFGREHPGTTVSVVEMPLADTATELAQAVAAGKGPDLALVAHTSLGALRAAEAVSPIELGAARSGFVAQAIAAFSAGDQVYGLPCAVATVGLVRNNTLTTAAPTGWNEVLTTGAAAIRDDTKKRAVVVGVGAEGDAYRLFGLQSSFGNTGFALKDDQTFGPEVTLGDDAGKAFASWLAAQGAKGTRALDIAIGADQAKQQFLDGNAAYWVTGPADAADLAAARLDSTVLALPAAGPQSARPFVGVEGFVLSARSKNALLASDLCTNYLGAVEFQVAASSGQLPALAAARRDDAIAENPLLAGFVDAGAAGVPAPTAATMGAVWPLWGAAESAVIGGADPAATWAAMAAEVDRVTNQG